MLEQPHLLQEERRMFDWMIFCKKKPTINQSAQMQLNLQVMFPLIFTMHRCICQTHHTTWQAMKSAGSPGKDKITFSFIPPDASLIGHHSVQSCMY